MNPIPISDLQGVACGHIDVPAEWLVTDRGAQAVQDVIVARRAGRRAGTASTLGKGQVAGSNKKPWRQKGLGRARAGYRQSPLWRGGGVVFGPHPRSYAKTVPRKVARLAFRRALSDKLAAGCVRAVEALRLSAPKTKEMATVLKTLGLTGRVLVVLDRVDAAVARATRNLPRVAVVAAQDASTEQLIGASHVLLNRAAWPILERRLKAPEGRA